MERGRGQLLIKPTEFILESPPAALMSAGAKQRRLCQEKPRFFFFFLLFFIKRDELVSLWRLRLSEGTRRPHLPSPQPAMYRWTHTHTHTRCSVITGLPVWSCTLQPSISPLSHLLLSFLLPVCVIYTFPSSPPSPPPLSFASPDRHGLIDFLQLISAREYTSRGAFFPPSELWISSVFDRPRHLCCPSLASLFGEVRRQLESLSQKIDFTASFLGLFPFVGVNIKYSLSLSLSFTAKYFRWDKMWKTGTNKQRGTNGFGAFLSRLQLALVFIHLSPLTCAHSPRSHQ